MAVNVDEEISGLLVSTICCSSLSGLRIAAPAQRFVEEVLAEL